MNPSTSELAHVGDWWNENVCGSQNATSRRFTREYFEEIETHRYRQEPFIFSFAQFPRWHGRDVLEVGVGAATDFLQWVRSGARAHGVDLTPEGVEHARTRLDAYGLRAADLRVANAEQLDYPDDRFDLVYSWGVIHHSPSIERALAEIVRVTRPGGTVKLMLYHRHSLTAAYVWVRWALLRGRPWMSVKECLSRFVESPGTKAVTRREVRRMLGAHGVTKAEVRTVLTHHDHGGDHRAVRWLGSALSRLLGERAGWFMLVEFRKPGAAS